MSTYLSTTPSFTSPQPLAASSGLTIPLQITLSNIRLSAFIILVFSRQKGLTLVFRNDPLESLKVSSTFDSIPFVRDYLQKEIEGQLRTLLMDEVPAIIHRLSLQWVPEFGGRADQEVRKGAEAPAEDEHVIDPLASPPQDAVDSAGRPLDASQIASITSDSSAESHALFSHKTLLRLAALNDSHRTLSLFTPTMKDVVFRAWVGPTERGERHGLSTPRTSLPDEFSRSSSYGHQMNTLHNRTDPTEKFATTRPLLATYGSGNSAIQLSRHNKAGRRRKHRVVNLRRTKAGLEENGSASDESNMSILSSTPGSEASFHLSSSSIPEEREGELTTPPDSPARHSASHFQLENPKKRESNSSKDPDATPRQSAILQDQSNSHDSTKLPPTPLKLQFLRPSKDDRQRSQRPSIRPTRYFASFQYPSDPSIQPGPSSGNSGQYPSPLSRSESSLDPLFPYLESSPGGILEQAWTMKMAGTIAGRVQEEKCATNFDSGNTAQRQRSETPPPAYGA